MFPLNLETTFFFANSEFIMLTFLILYPLILGKEQNLKISKTIFFLNFHNLFLLIFWQNFPKILSDLKIKSVFQVLVGSLLTVPLFLSL